VILALLLDLTIAVLAMSEYELSDDGCLAEGQKIHCFIEEPVRRDPNQLIKGKCGVGWFFSKTTNER
jgi:hypothetical protein